MIERELVFPGDKRLRPKLEVILRLFLLDWRLLDGSGTAKLTPPDPEPDKYLQV